MMVFLSALKKKKNIKSVKLAKYLGAITDPNHAK